MTTLTEHDKTIYVKDCIQLGEECFIVCTQGDTVVISSQDAVISFIQS